MEATFVVNPQEVDAQLLTRMLDFFKGKKEPVTVRLTDTAQEHFDWQQWFNGMEDIRKRTELVPVDVPPGTDINSLIDEMNSMEL